MSELRADIEENEEIIFIRQNPKVVTGQKTHSEVEGEINFRTARIKALFDCTLSKTNKKLEEIKKVHDQQLLKIFKFLKYTVTELEKSRSKHGGKNPRIHISAFVLASQFGDLLHNRVHRIKRPDSRLVILGRSTDIVILQQLFVKEYHVRFRPDVAYSIAQVRLAS